MINSKSNVCLNLKVTKDAMAIQNDFVYKFLDWNGLVKTLQNSSIKMTRADQFFTNDKYDCNPLEKSLQTIIRNLNAKFHNEDRNRINFILAANDPLNHRARQKNLYVYCVTSDMYDHVMWYEYAKLGQIASEPGVVLELNKIKLESRIQASLRFLKKILFEEEVSLHNVECWFNEFNEDIKNFEENPDRFQNEVYCKNVNYFELTNLEAVQKYVDKIEQIYKDIAKTIRNDEIPSINNETSFLEYHSKDNSYDFEKETRFIFPLENHPSGKGEVDYYQKIEEINNQNLKVQKIINKIIKLSEKGRDIFIPIDSSIINKIFFPPFHDEKKYKIFFEKFHDYEGKLDFDKLKNRDEINELVGIHQAKEISFA